jgi:hypothetical protein
VVYLIDIRYMLAKQHVKRSMLHVAIEGAYNADIGQCLDVWVNGFAKSSAVVIGL